MDNIITLTKQLGATATIVAYCNAQKGGTMKRHRELQELAESLDWDIYEGQLKNTHAGGSVEANTQYFVLSNTDIITEWKASAQTDTDPPEPMEAILDVNDGIFEDCNRYQVKTRDELKQQCSSYFAQVKGKINIAPYDEACRICKVYDIKYPLPNLAEDNNIMIEAMNGMTHQKSRPLWRHETLAAIGHLQRLHEWTSYEHWTKTYDRLKKTTPRQSWERIFATLHSLELNRTADRQHAHPTEEKRTMVAKVIIR
jgi:hypothetical protein